MPILARIAFVAQWTERWISTPSRRGFDSCQGHVKKCRECNGEFQPKRSSQLFCATKCTNAFSRNQLATVCKCGKKISKYSLQCLPCFNEAKKEDFIEQWLSGEHPGGSEHALSSAVRNYMLKLADYKCSVCGFDERHPVDGSCILEVDHIDGDGSNHVFGNLRVLCPNHHALTPTYRGRNAGRGRDVYYLRVKR